MSREAERHAITTFVNARWPQADYGPMAYPNRTFTPPSNSPWCALEIVDLTSSRESLGSQYLKRNLSSVQFDLYVPTGTGTQLIRRASDWLENEFESLTLTTSDGEYLVFGTTRSRDVSVEDSNWFRRIVLCDFRRDSVVTK